MRLLLYSLLFLTTLPLFAQTEKGATPIPDKSISNTQSSTYALVIGISDYQDEAIPDLRFADKDAEAFAAFLQSPAGGSLDDDHLKLLINEHATVAQFAKQLDWLLEVVKENDKVLLYFSGHGDVERKTLTQPGFLLCWDAPSSVYLAGGTLALPMFQEIISTLSIQNKAKVIVITDACRSGKLSGSGVGGTQLTSVNLAKQYANEIKILSCQPDEYSIEGEQWGGGRGAFSYHLLDGLLGLADKNTDQTVNLMEIRGYLEENVSTEVAPHNQMPMVIGSPREKLTDVYPEILDQLREGKNEQLTLFSSTESRGIEEEVLTVADSTIVALYFAFQEAIENKQFLEPETACADFYFDKLNREPQLEKLHSTMRRNYAAALQDDAQQAINGRLKSNEIDCTMTPKIKQALYNNFPSYLERAAELLGEDHYMYTILQARKLWFEGLLIQVADKAYKMEDQHFAEELSKYKKALHYQTEMPLAMLSIAETFELMNQLDSAEYYYQKILELYPAWALAVSYLCEFYSVEKIDLEKVKTLVDREFELDRHTSRPYRDLAYYYWDTSDRANAEKYFLKAIEINPNICNYMLAGNFYKQTDQHEKAIPMYRKVRAIDESFSNAYNGEIWSHLGINPDSLENAIQLAKLAIKKFPNEDRFYYQLSTGFTWFKQLEEGNAYFKKIVAANPDHAGPYIAYGDILVNLKRMDEALVQFKHALALYPSLQNYHAVITAYHRHDYWKEAYVFTAQALKIYPNDLWLLGHAGWQLLGLERYEEAKIIAEKYLELRPNNPSQLRQLGRIYMELQEYEKAIAPLLKATKVETDPIRLFRAHKSLASTYIELGRLVEATQQLEKCKEIKPDIRKNLQSPFWEYHYYLARIEVKKGNKKAAMEQVRKALETGGADPDMLLDNADLKALHNMPEWKEQIKKHFPEKG